MTLRQSHPKSKTFTFFKSSPPGVFLEKGVLNIYSKFIQENTHAEVHFNKIAL